MRLVLHGAPGCGKGTQAQRIEKEFGWPHISTGAIFRAEMKAGTELGRRAEAFITKGALVPDSLVIEIVDGRLALDDVRGGYILDGYPRTIAQAEALDRSSMAPELILKLVIDKDELVSRIYGRLTCANCGGMYHRSANPPKVEGKCDSCGGSLGRRGDDEADTVLKRFDVYQAESSPLDGWYRERGLLVELDAGNKDPDRIWNEIRQLLLQHIPR